MMAIWRVHVLCLEFGELVTWTINAVIGQVTFAAWQENPPYLHLFQTHLCDGLDPNKA
jgi:hypothetical protein